MSHDWLYSIYRKIWRQISQRGLYFWGLLLWWGKIRNMAIRTHGTDLCILSSCWAMLSLWAGRQVGPCNADRSLHCSARLGPIGPPLAVVEVAAGATDSPMDLTSSVAPLFDIDCRLVSRPSSGYFWKVK